MPDELFVTRGQAWLDQEWAEAREWRRGSDDRCIAQIALKLDQPDAQKALASLNPVEAELVARIAMLVLVQLEINFHSPKPE